MTEPKTLQLKLDKLKRFFEEHPETAKTICTFAGQQLMFRKFEKPDTSLMVFCSIIDRCREQCRMMGMTEDEIKDMEEDARTISYMTFESMPDAYKELVDRKRKEWLKR